MNLLQRLADEMRLSEAEPRSAADGAGGSRRGGAGAGEVGSPFPHSALRLLQAANSANAVKTVRAADRSSFGLAPACSAATSDVLDGDGAFAAAKKQTAGQTCTNFLDPQALAQPCRAQVF
jgi:hypothetical protein